MDSRKAFDLANAEPFTITKGLASGREFAIREYTYGVLVADSNSPLSCVSVSNNSISIDPWIGCKWQCAYCHVQGTAQDLTKTGKMSVSPLKRGAFSIDEIVDALVSHPFFMKDESIISIGTASTEPFASPEVTQSTFDIMDAFVKRGFHNPMWIVTKGGIPGGRKQDIARIVANTKGLMFSLCWADNPANIEPCRNNRFLRCEEAKEAGATLAWYLRPIVSEWSGTPEKIEMMMLWVQRHYGAYLDMIVPGGLRWTEGIENGLVEIHRLPMPDIPHNDNVKDLPDDLWDVITSLAGQYFPGVPVFRRSSCALSHMLRIPSIISVQETAPDDCGASVCSLEQRRRCGECTLATLSEEQVRQTISDLGIPLEVISWNPPMLVTGPSLSSCSYAIRQTVQKALTLQRRKLWKP